MLLLGRGLETASEGVHISLKAGIFRGTSIAMHDSRAGSCPSRQTSTKVAPSSGQRTEQGSLSADESILKLAKLACEALQAPAGAWPASGLGRQ